MGFALALPILRAALRHSASTTWLPVECRARGEHTRCDASSREAGGVGRQGRDQGRFSRAGAPNRRSEEHTSELQSLMRISYAVFCLKKKNTHTQQQHEQNKPY